MQNAGTDDAEFWNYFRVFEKKLKIKEETCKN